MPHPHPPCCPHAPVPPPQFLQRARPEAAPNAGYLAALLRLEEGLFGRQTVKVGVGMKGCAGLGWQGRGFAGRMVGPAPLLHGSSHHTPVPAKNRLSRLP